MTRAFLDPTFTQQVRRWGSCFTAALWLSSAVLLVLLAVWSV